MRPSIKRLLLMTRPSYLQRLLATEPANLLVAFPLSEGSGSTIVNAAPSGSGYNGSYTGVTWDGTLSPFGTPVPLWDGTSDYGNIYTTALASAFNGTAGTIVLWGKVGAASVWTDGTLRQLLRIAVDANNDVYIRRATANNSLQYIYVAGGTTKSILLSGQSSLDWLNLALTWDRAAGANGELKAFTNGIQTGSTQTSLGAWLGVPAATTTTIGAVNTTPSQVFSGYLAGVGIWSKALTAAQIAALAVT